MNQMENNKTHLFVDNYGEMIAQLNNAELVSFETDGGYQGDYCAVIKDEDRLFYYIGSYGSCSGCDWLEDKSSWYGIGDELDKQRQESGKNYCVEYKDAIEYWSNEKPKYIVPKDMPLNIVKKGQYEGFEVIK